MALLLTCAAFAATSPMLVIDPARTWAGMQNYRTISFGDGCAEAFSPDAAAPMLALGRQVFDEFGPVGVAAAVAAIGWLLWRCFAGRRRREGGATRAGGDPTRTFHVRALGGNAADGRQRLRRAAYAMVAVVPPVFFLVVGAARLPRIYYFLPCIPMICLALAVGLRDAADALGRRRAVLRPATLAAGFVLLAAFPWSQAIHFDRQRLATPTQLLARQWMFDHLPADAKLAIEHNTPPVKRAPDGLPACDRFQVVFPIENDYDAFDGSQKWYEDAEASTPTPQALRAAGVEYVVVNSESYTQYGWRPELFPRRLGFYRWLEQHCPRLACFPATPDRIGPEIRIYQLPTQQADASAPK